MRSRGTAFRENEDGDRVGEGTLRFPLATGLLPFLATALLSWIAAEDWRGVALYALAAYGAVILSFLGAVHWGLALRAPASEAEAAAPPAAQRTHSRRARPRHTRSPSRASAATLTVAFTWFGLTTSSLVTVMPGE